MSQYPKFKRQRGVAAVELGFLVIFLLLIAAGIFDFGRAFWYYNTLAKATRDGARAFSVSDLSATAIGQAQDLVVAEANGANLRPALTTSNVTVSCFPGGCSASPRPSNFMVEVQITDYQIDIAGLFPIIAPDYSVHFYSDVPLAPHTTMRYMK